MKSYFGSGTGTKVSHPLKADRAHYATSTNIRVGGLRYLCLTPVELREAMDAETNLGTKRNRFLVKNPENGDLNQYWYSQATIDAIAAEVVEVGSGGTAFLSTPSIFFSLDKDMRKKCKVFDADTKWAKDPGFVLYDFNRPQDIPQNVRGTFDMVVTDPPFITEEVWQKYTAATKMLLRPGGPGLVLCSTISENASFMKELLGAKPCEFKPSIPNLVYQYSLYVNYDSDRLGAANPEIPVD